MTTEHGPAWHALDAREVLARLRTSPDGLGEAEAAARLATSGPNALEPSRPVSAWRILAGQLRSVVVLLLVAGAALSLLTGDLVDAAAIGTVLALNVALGFWTELRARRAMEALVALQVPTATVVRGALAREVDARTLVAGDVISLEAGQAVPADARLIRAAELRTVEAALTGESLPAEKRAGDALAEATALPERTTMVYLATTVAAGSARAVVVATGAATELGRIGALVGAVEPEPTPLERRLDQLGRRLAAAALGAAALIAAMSFWHGAPLAGVLALAVAVAVAAVPEGLPAAVTITTAIGVRRMARRHALVRRLPMVETLGSTTVVCTDKTGTLTAGEMAVVALWVDGRELAVSGEGYAPEGDFRHEGRSVHHLEDAVLASALRVGMLANRADVARGAHGWEPRGDPTDAALLVAARKAGLARETLLADWPEEGEVPFSSERMLMATFHRASGSSGGGLVAHAKGAPARILERCDRVLTARGAVPLDDQRRRALEARNEALAARGLRVIALAHGPAERADAAALRGLTFVAFAGLLDPPAPGVAETIRALRGAGVRTVMLTGDQRATAEAVARELGLLSPGAEVLSGSDVDAMSDDRLAERAGTVGAVSRVSPEGKLRVVAALQRTGEVVAMLGDGVNDAAALKRADVGVAMGRRGTDVAKEAAGIVLADDRFRTIAAAVEEGRVVFDDIRKFVFYLFSCNLAELLVLLGAGVAGLPLPLLPLQILWLNLVTDTFPALALALEPAEPDVMRRPPRDPRSALLGRREVGALAGYAALIAAVTLAAFLWGLRGGDAARATALCFTTLSLAQLLHLGNARSRSAVVRLGPALSNPYAVGALALGVALQLLAGYWAPLASVLGVAALPAADWLVIAPLAAVPALVGQALKGRRPPSAPGECPPGGSYSRAVASSEIRRSSVSAASPLMIDDHESSCPRRFPFSTTFTPSGEMVTV